MSLNQWKLLNQLKDSLYKFSSDSSNSLQNYVTKDLFPNVQQKLPSTIVELSKFFHDQAEKLPKISGTTSLPATLDKKDHETKEVTASSWKTNKHFVSNSTISSQTQHVISSLKSAENDESFLKRIEALISHLKQFPDGRKSAIRDGAIRVLLQIRLQIPKNENIQDAIREALALLGYSDPVPSNGIRILSMDGGGIRGLLILEMLKKLEELTGERVDELFDLFCGVSTGAILLFAIGIHHRSLDEIARGYKEISMDVFKQSPLWGTGNLVWSQAYYDTALWEKKLKEHLGTNCLIQTARDPKCPKLCAVSAVVNQSRLSAYAFRNYTLPWWVKSEYFGSNQHEIWEAARASAAAPTYFEECKLGKFIHQDGGILVNNPTAVAIHEAKLIWPNTPIQCVVSFGTGRSVPSPSDSLHKSTDKSTSWTNKFYKILDSATDTEGVHIMLNDLLPDSVYYRFNPYLTEMISMVEINPDKLEQLERDAVMYLRRNEDKFQEAAKVLMQKKSFIRKLHDYTDFKRNLYGFYT